MNDATLSSSLMSNSNRASLTNQYRQTILLNMQGVASFDHKDYNAKENK